MSPARKLEVTVLDGGLSQPSRNTLSKLTGRIGGDAGLEFLKADASVFGAATIGPGQSHITYCRILLPQLVNVPRLIYLDCDTLVFRDVSDLFYIEFVSHMALASVCDS